MVNINTRTTLSQQVPEGMMDNAYAGKVAMQTAATLPVVGKAFAVGGAAMQLSELQKAFSTQQGFQNKGFVALQMAGTTTMLGLSLLAPRAAAVFTGSSRVYTSVKDLYNHVLENKEWKTLALDAFRAGSNVVYIASMVSGNPVFIAISLVAQGSEDICEGATMIYKHWDGKDWMTIGAASLQIGLGALRGSQGLSIGANYAMASTQKPEAARLIEEGAELVTGELDQAQLKKINQYFDEDQETRLTYAKLDDKGRVIKANMLEQEEDMQLNLEWKVRASNNLKMTFDGYVNDGMDQELMDVIGNHSVALHWDRPRGSDLPVRSVRGNVNWGLNQTEFTAHALVDKEWFILKANNELSNGIQESLIGDTIDAKEEFTNFAESIFELTEDIEDICL